MTNTEFPGGLRKTVMIHNFFELEFQWIIKANKSQKHPLQVHGSFITTILGLNTEFYGVVSEDFDNRKFFVDITSCDTTAEQFLPQFKERADIL